MLRTILVDDETPARDELRYMLETNHADAVHIIGEADTATNAISLITKSQPDLIFLDIHMPGLSGLEIASVIHDISPNSIIIFATAYDEYALQAFELQALDYVVKPIEEERLTKAIQRARQVLRDDTDTYATTQPTGNTPPAAATTTEAPPGASDADEPLMPRPNKLAVDNGAHILLIDLDSIYFITGESGRLEVHTTTGIYSSNKTLADIQERVKGTTLYRVHRSYIVNLNRVREVVPWFKGTYWLRLPNKTAKGEELIDIPVSKAQVKLIKEILGIG